MNDFRYAGSPPPPHCSARRQRPGRPHAGAVLSGARPLTSPCSPAALTPPPGKPCIGMGKHLGPWVETLEGADVCIHLSGRSVNCRYTERNRRELRESRIGPTLPAARGHSPVANPPRSLDECLIRHHLPALPRPRHGRSHWRDRRRRDDLALSARSREMELDRSARQGLGGCILPNSYAEHAQSRAAYLACLQPLRPAASSP